MAEGYVCTLTEQSLKTAKEELHEDPKERLGSVATLKDWIVAQPHIKCEGDAKYLLKFLRVSKFSQLIAREKIEKWISALDIIGEWLRNIDFNDPEYMEFFDTGYVTVLPGRDRLGRKVFMFRPGKLDVSGRFTKSQVMKAVFGVYMYLMLDENTQVNGIVYFMDFTGFEMKQMLFFGLDDMKKMTRMWQGVFPGRFKGFHYYNTGAVFDTMMTAMMPLLSKKFKDRINLHGNNLENVYKVIPKEMLPTEYLPDDHKGQSAGPFKDLIETLKKEMSRPEVVSRIKFETGENFVIDPEKRLTYEQASYRKLNTD